MPSKNEDSAPSGPYRYLRGRRLPIWNCSHPEITPDAYSACAGLSPTFSEVKSVDHLVENQYLTDSSFLMRAEVSKAAIDLIELSRSENVSEADLHKLALYFIEMLEKSHLSYIDHLVDTNASGENIVAWSIDATTLGACREMLLRVNIL